MCYAGAWNEALQDGMQDPAAKRQIIYNQTKGSPDFVAHHQPFNYFARFAPGTADRELHLQDASAFFAGIAHGELPQVVFYKPQGSLNEHPGSRTCCPVMRILPTLSRESGRARFGRQSRKSCHDV